MTLHDLRAEYQSVRIGPRIWALVLEMTSAVARRYPPRVYNHGEPWTDESVQDLAQQVVLDRLLGEAQLEYLFDQATSIESSRRLLALQIRRTLAHRRRKTVVDRLLTRVRRLAQEPPFRPHAVGRSVWVSDKDFSGPLADLSDSRISHIASAVRDIPQLAASKESSRASMIYTTADLRLLLERVVSEAGAVSERDLARVFENLLTSCLPTFLQDPEGDYPSEEPTPEEAAEDAQMRAAVETFARDLSEPERWILLGKSQGIADGDIAARLGRSRPWVAQRKHGILERLATELMSQFDADRHVPAMEDLLARISHSLGESAEP
ncbi:MAG: hypothetical protein F4Z17_07675 [Acidimicrobiia bacterium]|nr:hypothetical protein [Acidimicrobiia bacterium]